MDISGVGQTRVTLVSSCFRMREESHSRLPQPVQVDIWQGNCAHLICRIIFKVPFIASQSHQRSGCCTFVVLESVDLNIKHNFPKRETAAILIVSRITVDVDVFDALSALKALCIEGQWRLFRVVGRIECSPSPDTVSPTFR